MTLAEFLLARLAESTEYWRARRTREIDRQSIDRVLADFDAKRRIVDEHTEAGTKWCPSCDGQDQPCTTIRLLALSYADHPGYRDEWRAP